LNRVAAENKQLAEKDIFSRLLKNAQMQGPRNPEAQGNINRSVLGGVRRDDEGSGKRSRWVFFSSLLNNNL
jgi:hypothetical protein